MSDSPQPKRSAAKTAPARAVTLLGLLFLSAGGAKTAGEGLPPEELHTAGEIRRLTAEEAALPHPVRLRGVITFFDQSLFSRFLQDGTAGIYLADDTNSPSLTPGQFVEIEGVTGPGEYAPVVAARKVQVLGEAELPEARPVAFDRLASGQEDSQFVEIHGIVRSVRTDENTPWRLIDIATGGGRLTAYARDLPLASSAGLVDSNVRVRGVCVTRFNQQRQLFDIRLLVPRRSDLWIEKSAPADPFDIPTRRIASLLQFAPEGTVGHRVKVAGTVIYPPWGGALYIQDESEGVYVQTRQTESLRVGDRVEVVGFPAKGEYTPMLQDAAFRKIGPGPLPIPDEIDFDGALNGTHDCRLVRLEATLLDRARHSREQFLVLQAGGFLFHAYLNREGDEADFEALENGSRVAVTGVCLIEAGSDWFAGAAWRAKSFRILLRSPGDITVLRQPPWWTLGKLLWMVGVLGVVVLAAFGWVGVLRRRVQQQTGIIRQKLQTEAALKERYADLLENANDMVYTHDLTGRITSVNQAGERLLQRGRADILDRPLADLVVVEQQAAARDWLAQVVCGPAPPTAEWDFASASGPPIRLEISARLIEQDGRIVEVEGIARDITERKRLEREILEISNREQRRIGHDLHDGVCQQLAGTAYLAEILADQLHEKGAPESAEAEKLGRLIKEAITQTRSVARGLFPVRLEQNGLVSALEELAANAAGLFKVHCHFACDEPPPVVDNEIALHVYYIAQEAVLNAAKHGQARNVQLRLEPAQARWSLAVRDDGVGLPPPGSRRSGMGLRIMHYRARVIGATLDLQSDPGSGTLVVCRFTPTLREPRPATSLDGADEARAGLPVARIKNL